MKAAVLGTSGYTGQLLLRLLIGHPEVDKIIPVSLSKEGEAIQVVDKSLCIHALAKFDLTEGRCVSLSQAQGLKPDVVFACLPHLKSGEVCACFLGQAVIIDLSADFRFRQAEVFNKAYGSPPPRPDLLSQAVYGLAEWYTEQIKKTDLIANPGCYTTASLLPLLPLAREGLIGQQPVIINALSGISGAGKKTEATYLFAERTENVSPYAPGTSHRHCAEIQAELSANGSKQRVFFNPHLVPMARGICATISVALTRQMTLNEIFSLYKNYYGTKVFIGLRERGIPQTAEVWGTNRCDIGFHLEEKQLFIFSVIDNLVKGASGQAIQNMNLRFGLSETAALAVNRP